MTLLQTMLEVFPRNLIRIGSQVSFKILDMCVGSYLIPNLTPIISTRQLCSQKRFYCVKRLPLILDVMILSTFEHEYIITSWCPTEFSE